MEDFFDASIRIYAYIHRHVHKTYICNNSGIRVSDRREEHQKVLAAAKLGSTTAPFCKSGCSSFPVTCRAAPLMAGFLGPGIEPERLHVTPQSPHICTHTVTSVSRKFKPKYVWENSNPNMFVIPKSSISTRQFLGLDLTWKQGFIHSYPSEAKGHLRESSTRRESVVFDLHFKWMRQQCLRSILYTLILALKNVFRKHCPCLQQFISLLGTSEKIGYVEWKISIAH